MTLVAEEVRIDVPVSGAPRRGVVSRVFGRLGNGFVQVLLALVAVFWLVPVFGLLIASLRDESANTASGWWTVFTNPDFTLDNYFEALNSGGTSTTLASAFVNSLAITIPATVFPIVMAALAAYAFAWIDFKGRSALFVFVAWVAVVMPAYAGLVLQGAALVGCYLADRKGYASSGVAAWLTLRFRLTAVASLCCFLAAAGS